MQSTINQHFMLMGAVVVGALAGWYGFSLVLNAAVAG